MRLHTLNINDNLTFVNEKKDQWENSFIVKCLQMWFILMVKWFIFKWKTRMRENEFWVKEDIMNVQINE